MNYATIKNCDIANGPGVRVSLFVSGCTHRCKGCFNEVAWDFAYGQPFTAETEKMLLDMLAPSHIKGLTLLGGEPFDPRNQGALVAFLKKVRAAYPEKSIVLVDGPFVEAKKNLSLRFRGSENQRIIDIPATLQTGETVLWQDWQGEKRGMKK